MPRRLVDPRPYEVHPLALPPASDPDRSIAQQIHERFFADTDVAFALYAVPMSELVESALIGAVLRREFPAETYEHWRRTETPEARVREAFAQAQAQQRSSPAFAKELPLIEALER